MASYGAYLGSALLKYRYADITKKEVLNVFETFVDLRPNLDSYVFNDGTKKELLCLMGTIPISYKAKPYNIPICVWLLDTHPYNPPMVFVKPTPTMQIKPGRHVDNTGRVYLPYLHEWKHPTSDLLGLLEVMAIVFGEEPPVYSKPGVPSGTGTAQTLSTTWPLSGPTFVPPFPTNPAYPGYPTSSNLAVNPYLGAFDPDNLSRKIRPPEDVQPKLPGVEQNIANSQGSDVEIENQNEAAAPQSPTNAQLLSAMAEEHAAEDELYNLGEQLRAGVIDIDEFLKQVRELFRKQSVLRLQFTGDRQGSQKPRVPNICG